MAAGAGASAPVAWLLAAGVTAAALAASASAQSGCTTTLISLYPCLNYISGNVSTPPPSCCSQLASVVQTSPQCLCAALSSDSSSLGGVTIDRTRALQLPQACSVKTPPASKCNSVGGGSAPGAATPAAPSSGVPATAAAGTGSGSKATPTAPFLTSGGASVRGAVSLALAFAAVAVYAISAA
ncbi:Non-specific lipid transfer protein GPI-anchored 2 [Zea mays]|uniref:Non-specific lipid transfer protein GPI-anchored 2 n=1 Tax=Zea mays TaxID=4577 RepID=A0A3L6EN79_MAIZE|nr:Non-specific lipid transfer protein GPI-anchored 2 [Zea mays]